MKYYKITKTEMDQIKDLLGDYLETQYMVFGDDADEDSCASTLKSLLDVLLDKELFED